eukprot:4689628-Alexandrium_andersonii.AAC.1
MVVCDCEQFHALLDPFVLDDLFCVPNCCYPTLFAIWIESLGCADVPKGIEMVYIADTPDSGHEDFEECPFLPLELGD